MSYDPNEVHNGFDPTKHYQRILRRDAADAYLTGQDENEADSMRLRQITNLGSAVLAEGKVVSGSAIAVNAGNGATTVAAGQVFAKGLVREPAAASFTVPTSGDLFVGIWLKTSVVDEEDDSDLVFDPPGTSFPASGSPLMPREQQLPSWGKSTDSHSNTADETWTFTPVYRIKDGVVIYADERDAWDDDLERYDREAHGSYSVSGMIVSPLGASGGAQVFSISAGVANAFGRKIERTFDIRHSETEDPPLRSVAAEHHTYINSGGTSIITLNYGPIAEVTELVILAEKAVTVTKGVANAADALPDSSIDSIVSAVQGGTTYTVTADYTKVGDTISWAPGGSEPAPGSSYVVTYRYFKVVTPDAVGADTVTVSGAVDGSTVSFDYDYKVKRIDILAIDADGEIQYLEGPVNWLSPQPPAVPSTLLALAQITNDWRATPVVEQVAPVAVPFSDLADLKASLEDLRATVSRLSLQVALGVDQPSSRDKQFVDPLDDDDGRDLGQAQTGAVSGGALRLPITVSYQDLGLTGQVKPTTALTRIRTKETANGAIALQNGSDRFAAMEILDAADPRFVFDNVIAADTELLARDVPWFQTRAKGRANNERASAKLKGQTLSVTVRGVTSGATLTALTFDGAAATPTGGTANGSGVSTFTFPVPANLPAGWKRVEATYSDGSTAKAVWDGTLGGAMGAAWGQTRPCAVLFGIPALGDWLGKVQFQIHAVSGSAPIYWELRTGAITTENVVVGSVEASGVIDMAGKSAGDWIEITLPLGFGRDAGVRFGNGPWSAVIGLQSASNHQIKTSAGDDTNLNATANTLVHRIDAARVTAGALTTLATKAVTGITEFTVLAADGGTNTRFVATLGSDNYELVSGQVVPLAAAFTGNVVVKAKLDDFSTAPGGRFKQVLPGAMLVTGVHGTTGTYISLALAEATSDTVAVYFSAYKPVGATIAVDVWNGSSWVSMTQVAATPLGNGVYDFRFEKTIFTSTTPKIRITMTGSVTTPIYIDDIRGVVY